MDGNNPRVWKSMVPGVGAAAVLMLQMWIGGSGKPWMQLYCAYATVPVMILLAVQCLVMFWAYYARIFNDEFVERRRALSTTAETKLFEMARMMHPETVKLLLMHRKTKWRIKEAKVNELVDWVLDADPRIRYEFVEYVLVNSNQYAMMPMGRLSDKSFQFDPDRLVNDYDQYRAFHKLLMNRMMVTDALGNQAGQWIEPWNPELVARQFGIALVEESEPLSVISEQKLEAEGGRPLRDAESGKQKAKAQVQERELTDLEMENIRELEETHRSALDHADQEKYSTTVEKFLASKKLNKQGDLQ
jgi:hypothetical protein